MAIAICWTQCKERIEKEKNGYKDGKALCKLMSNAVYGKKNGKLKK